MGLLLKYFHWKLFAKFTVAVSCVALLVLFFVGVLKQQRTMQRIDRNTHHKYCNVYDMDNKSVQNLRFPCITMKTSPPAVICLYSRGHTASESIKRSGTWEKTVHELIIESIKDSPDKGFIDIGASIGAHTLPVAVMGNRVVAVEPAPINIQRLHKALLLNNISTQKVTIVQNALSNEHGNITAHRNHNNPGLQSTVKSKGPNSVIVDVYKSIYMDDLLGVIDFSEAILKIDIEASEPRAFAHASKLFQHIQITHVFMEWANSATYYWKRQREGQEGKRLMDKMLEFFYTQGYQAYTVKSVLLKKEDAMNWPVDIFWFKTF